MVAEDDPHFMYNINFNPDYVVDLLVISQARCYLKRDPLAYEITANVRSTTCHVMSRNYSSRHQHEVEQDRGSDSTFQAVRRKLEPFPRKKYGGG